MAAIAERRTEKLDFRVAQSAKVKLQAAATILHRSVSDFVMESALSKAEETLADRRTFGLDEAAWKSLQEVLNAPPRSLPRLEALLREPGFFGDNSAE